MSVDQLGEALQAYRIEAEKWKDVAECYKAALGYSKEATKLAEQSADQWKHRAQSSRHLASVLAVVVVILAISDIVLIGILA